MPVRSYAFVTHGSTPAVEVRNPAGTVTVTGVESATQAEVTVDPLNRAAEAMLDEVTVQFLPSGLDDVDPRSASLLVAVPHGRLLSNPRFAITVTVPAGCPATIVTASADTVLRGPLTDVSVTGASADVLIEACTGLRVRSASGTVRASTVDGDLSAQSASGELHVGNVAGAATVKTASGDVRLGSVGGDVDVTTASADVSVGRMRTGELRLRTVSGDATVAIEPGLRLWLDLQSVSGKLDSQLAPSDDDETDATPATLSVQMRSVSGDLRLRRAR